MRSFAAEFNLQTIMAQSGSRYINVLTDYGFKRVFGDEEVMRAFLTDLLQPKSPISEITFLDKELDGLSQYERGVVYDLFCRTEDGGEFIVEMQNRSQPHFADRILYYLSRSFSSQVERGDKEWDFTLKPVYCICFLNFHLNGFTPSRQRTVQLKVEETEEIFSDKLKVYTLELPDYRSMREEDCKTQMDYWLYNIANLETMTTNLPFQQQQPVFEKVGNIAELVRMTPDELKQYNISIDTYRTNLSIMRNERAEGRAEGLAEGMARGMAKGMEKGHAEGMAKGRAEERAKAESEKLDIASQLLVTGMSAAQVSLITKLPLETINALVK